MDFGLDDFGDVPVDNSAPPERLLLDEGEHDLEIKLVSKLDDGRVEIRLAHDDKKYSWVFAKLPLDVDWSRRILSSLRKAIGATREQWAAMDPKALEGRKVKTRVYQRTTPGGTFVNVGEFLPGPAFEQFQEEAKPAKKPAARTAAAKAKAAGVGGADDDVPF